jgi:hypothetical protein
MKDKTYFAKSGAWAKMSKLHPSGLYLVEVFTPAGSRHDKTRCDQYRAALDDYRAFRKVADNL